MLHYLSLQKFGPSLPYSLLKRMPFAVPVDSLHACFLGVVDDILQLVMTKNLHLMEHNRLPHFEEMVRRFVLWPSFIHRKFLSLTNLATMKGTQLQNFLLLLPAFRGCMHPSVLHLLLALHSAISILDGDSISDADIDKAQVILRAFYCTVKDVLGEQLLGTNFHLLLHLPEQVCNLAVGIGVAINHEVLCNHRYVRWALYGLRVRWHLRATCSSSRV